MNTSLRILVALGLVTVLAGPAFADNDDTVNSGDSVIRPPSQVDLGAPQPVQTTGTTTTATTSTPATVNAANGEAGNLLRSEIQLERIRWERAVTAVNELTEQARGVINKPKDELQADDFAEARRLTQQAGNILKSNENVAVVSEYRTLEKNISDLDAFIDANESEWNREQVRIDRDKAADAERKRLEREAQARQRRINELLAQARSARQEREFGVAMELLREALDLNPNLREARWMYEDTETANVIHRQEAINQRKDIEFRNTLLNVREALTPYDDPMTYPSADVWHALTEQRQRWAAGLPPEPPANVRVRELMQKNVPEIRFKQIQFESAINFLRDLQRVNINPNWRAMEQVGITRDTEVTLQLRDVTLETALRELLSKVAGREDTLDYMIRDGVIKISTGDDLESIKYILVYDVRDLLHPLTDFRVPRTERSLGDDDDDGGGDDDGLFGDDDDDDDSGTEGAEISRQQQVDKFLNIVRTSVQPDTWAPTGDASVLESDGLLIIKQTANGHRDLAKLLQQLREHSRMQISIEVRFLTIESSFLEDIGVDLDFIFNRRGSASSGWGQVPVDTSTFTHGVLNPSTGGFLDSDGVSTLQSVGAADIFQLGRSSLVVAGSFFDDLQVDFFLRATQAHQHSSRLNTLRVTLLNGHEAYIIVETQTDFVSDLTPQVAQSATAFDPETDQLIDGISFGVRATITADRRYVIMTVYPTLRDDTLAGEFRFQQGSDTGTADDDTGGGNVIIDDGAASTDAQIQLRAASIQEVRTTVMVPDRGTLLLGGQRVADELEVETGVPILSKVPVLKRFFTTRSYVKRERTLLMLIRPEILIPEELEP